MIKHPLFTFLQYPQYKIGDWINGSIFGLNTKRFYESKKKIIRFSIYQRKTHYRFLSLMILLHWLTKTNFFNIYDEETAKNKTYLVNNLWVSYFYYHKYSDYQPLVQAFINMLESEFFDEKLLDKIKKMEVHGECDFFYKEEYAMTYFSMCEYQSKNKNILGKLIYPDDPPTALDLLKKSVVPTINKGINLIKQAVNPIMAYKNKAQSLRQDAQSVIQKFALLSEEEKIVFAEDYFKNYSYYNEANIMMKNMKDLYVLSKRYGIKNETLKHDYERVLDKHLYDLLVFMEIYRNQKMDTILEQINTINSMVKKIHKQLDQEVKKLIRVKNRFLNEKNNNKEES